MRSRTREVGVNEKDVVFTELSLNLTERFIHSFTQRPERVEGFTERAVSLKDFTQFIHSISFHRTQNTGRDRACSTRLSAAAVKLVSTQGLFHSSLCAACTRRPC